MQLMHSYNIALRCTSSAETYRKYAEFYDGPHGAKDPNQLYTIYSDQPACGFNHGYGKSWILQTNAGRSTVEPSKKGHFGNGTFVLSSEVVLISEVHEIF